LTDVDNADCRRYNTPVTEDIPMPEEKTPAKPRVDPSLDRAIPADKPLVPLGAKMKPLGELEPILAIGKPLRNPNDKPKDVKMERERVALLAKDQLRCPVEFLRTEATKVGETSYRVNWLALDKGKSDKKGAVDTDVAPPAMLLTTYKRVHSALVRVVWANPPILTEIPGAAKR
jgi:hypothetical protein